MEAGLPNTLSCIFRDSRGFVWTGTLSGLGRFDGYEQRKYIYQKDKPHSLPGNKIYCIIEDNNDNLLVMTDRGVVQYNYHNNDFTALTDINGYPYLAYSACQWQDKLLLGGKNEILIFDGKTRSIKRLFNLKTENNFAISKIAIVDSQTLICGSRWSGIYTVNLERGTTTRAPFGCGEEITDLFVDSMQRIWIAPYNQGLCCYTMDKKNSTSYTANNSNLSSNIIISITERKGKIWIGTDGGGINILDPKDMSFKHLNHIPGDRYYSLPTNSINCLYKDRYDNIWIGGVYNGLINIREASMKTYTEALMNKSNAMSQSIVLSLYHQSPEQIWIGTDGCGLISFNPKSEQFITHPATKNDKITSICEFQNGKMLMSIFADGLYIFDPRNGEKTPFQVMNENITKTISKHGYSVYLYRNTSNTITILSDHVYIYDLVEKKFTIAKEETANLINWGTLQSIGSDGTDTYLFDQNRIYSLDQKTQSLKVIHAFVDNISINSVAFDPQGFFWIGSNLGLLRYNIKEKTISPIHTNLFADVSVVVCNQGNEIWIGAENRLISYIPDVNKFILFGESDGVIPNEFIARAQLIADSKNIYIGGVKGLLHISDQWKTVQQDHPKLQLSRILINGESVARKDDEINGILKVPWESNISIQVMAKEENIFRKKLYRYRIEGLDKTNSESYNPELNIHAPHQGSYRILASCTTKDGRWIPEEEILILEVLPPWYLTWWFISLCIIILALIVVEIFRKILKNKDQNLKWAMKEHEQHVYEEKIRFLINISQELLTPLTLIYDPLKHILKSMSSDTAFYSPLKNIFRQTKRMESLLNMVLDVRKMEEGKNKLHIQPHHLNNWIKNASDDFLNENCDQPIQIHFNLDPKIEFISFDMDKCEIIFINLLMNAIKNNIQQSSITISTEILTTGEMVRVSITDNEKETQNLNKEKDNNSDQQRQSIGIGLAFAKILIEQHEGTIGINKNLDSITTYYYDLPLRTTAQDITTKPKEYLNELVSEDFNESFLEETNFDTTSYSVLIVDDSQDMVDFLNKNLYLHYRTLFSASDGEEAFRLIKRHTPDIIISDVMMPRMNGYQLCKQIKEDIEISHIPVILLLGHDDEQSKKEGYKTGADAILTKPFEVETLIEIIDNRLKNRANIRKRYMNAGPIPIPEDSTFSHADEKFLFKLNNVILENIENCDLNIPYICKEIGISRASLYLKLKALTAMSANEYINKFRMEKAIVMINTTDMAFSEIAEKVGFSTSSYFSTAFKQYIGVTPTQYKKELRQRVKK